MLNTIYKLASGSIAKSLKLVLDILINNDQTGFIKGRFIGENTRLLYDIMNYTEHNKIPGLLMMIDFEKAFDTLSTEFIKKLLIFLTLVPCLKNGYRYFILTSLHLFN